MNAYDVFIDPTVISSSLACNFIKPTEKHLLVAKATILEIYEVLKIQQPEGKEPGYRLKLISSYKLQGLVKDLKAIKTVENRDLDYVLVSFESAKVSCLKWDPVKYSVLTVSLHFYEHALQNASYEKIYKTDLLVGPPSKPMFCLRRNNLLVFLPFNNLDDDEDDGDDGDDDQEHASKTLDDTSIDDVLLQSTRNNLLQNEGDIINALSPHDLFDASIIIGASSLDPSVGEIIDLQFLHNYREPTIAVLSQVKKTWAGLLAQEKDNVVYSVWSLDIQSSSATTIFKIEGLPFDVDRIVPLLHPLNGALLVGCNELAHVDSGGITRRISLNLFVADITQSIKTFADASLKELKLEDCSIGMIPNDSKIIVILRTGEMHLVTFDVDGKTIKGIDMHRVDDNLYASCKMENSGQIVTLSDSLLFFAGKTSDSALVEVRYTDLSAQPSSEVVSDAQLTTHTQNLDEEDENLYDEDNKVLNRIRTDGSISFIRHDSITSNGPISSFTLGKFSADKFLANLPNPSYDEISVFAAGGVGSAAHLNVMTPTVQPIIRSSLRFSELHRLWISSNRYLITSDDTNQKSEIFDINRSYARIPSKHFVNSESTIAMHELDNGNFILQVTPKQILLFNDKLKKIASLDHQLKEFGDAYIVNSVSSDELLMIFFSTGEVVIYSINTYNKVFTKVELPKLLSDTIITTGYITNSRLLSVVLKDLSVLTNRGQKRRRDAENGLAYTPETSAIMKLKTFVLVTGDNRVVVFSRFHNEKCFQLNYANKFSNHLSLGFFDINGADPDPFIKQVIFNELGDDVVKDEYLTILTVGGEIYTYKMYFDGENYAFIKEVGLPVTGAPHNAYPHGTSLERRMIYFPNVSGLTCVMVTGVVPYLITRSRHSLVRIHKFSKIPIISFVPFSDDKLSNGLIYLDTKKNARIVELPKDFSYENNWPIKKIQIGETVKSVAYHESSHTFIVSTFKEISYDSLDEDGQPIVGTRLERPLALSYKGQLHLISPISWTAIDSIPLESNEVALLIKSMALDIGSENKKFKRKKELVLIGTGKYRTEDLSANGSFRLLEIIDIIPTPGKPETNHKFKEITTEDTKGAVTAICDVSGRFLVSQGQKVIIRDIKDATAVSVAFMDLSVFVSEAKSFGNLLLFGDTLKSITLAGFEAEPFRMLLLAKDTHGFDVSCADFIYKDEEIFILVADNENKIHVLQYNPEDPASANGQRLLRKSSFNTNYSTTCMKTIPKHEIFSDGIVASNVSFQTIASTAEGAMYVVFPVEESSFRRMFILQQQLMDKEYHFCGLNPRLNRVGPCEPDTIQSLRPILDCELLKRYAKLSQDRMRFFEHKISVKSVASDIWRDLIEFENVLKNL
ncbi:cleavage and polyadenylation specificity factor subunit 1 [Metschnikowia aff. pulcherrima]|uniref:Cleavage and polyadenylation specificity factor subunit 1 n=1 Tax=Metschnikowia aff. pulcherrima TaxID=2163413 RepID=A0A4P6XRU7_9ASCO|nr:cleavage and polyadenylation specificity factor subunit 1 [Metschnikowia aff. pulcherrima]